jgi:anti-sigma B factor antagonist
MPSKHSVIKLQLPERLNESEVATFLKVLQPLLDGHHSRVVLDCSRVQHINSVGVEMLLRCLEEAMKPDSDLKVAGASPSSAIILDLMRIAQLFEVFETPEEAADSFQQVVSLGKTPAQAWESAA